jgi:hypothetical protein
MTLDVRRSATFNGVAQSTPTVPMGMNGLLTTLIAVAVFHCPLRIPNRGLFFEIVFHWNKPLLLKAAAILVQHQMKPMDIRKRTLHQSQEQMKQCQYLSTRQALRFVANSDHFQIRKGMEHIRLQLMME